MWGIHRWPVNSPHKWSVTRKMFPFDDFIMHLPPPPSSWTLAQSQYKNHLFGYRDYHCEDKMVSWLSYLYNGNSDTSKTMYLYWDSFLGADSIQRCLLTSLGNPIVEIKWSYDSLIFTMGFPILVRWHRYIESGPCSPVIAKQAE